MGLAETAKKLRKAADITQAATAKGMNIGRVSYVKKEKGETPFSIDEMFSLLTFFKDKVSEDIYIGEVGELLQEKLGSVFDLLVTPKGGRGKQPPKNLTVLEHQDLVQQFKYKKKGLDANKSLLAIEAINEELFFFLVGRLEYISAKIEAGETVSPDNRNDLFTGGDSAVNLD